MIAAVVIAVGFMLVFAGPISRFVERHPTVKMLALSFLLLIGVALIAEGFDQHIPKGYIYFAMAFSVVRRDAEPAAAPSRRARQASRERHPRGKAKSTLTLARRGQRRNIVGAHVDPRTRRFRLSRGAGRRLASRGGRVDPARCGLEVPRPWVGSRHRLARARVRRRRLAGRERRSSVTATAMNRPWSPTAPTRTRSTSRRTSGARSPWPTLRCTKASTCE